MRINEFLLINKFDFNLPSLILKFSTSQSEWFWQIILEYPLDSHVSTRATFYFETIIAIDTK
jgi:hypothetical protein